MAGSLTSAGSSSRPRDMRGDTFEGVFETTAGKTFQKPRSLNLDTGEVREPAKPAYSSIQAVLNSGEASPIPTVPEDGMLVQFTVFMKVSNDFANRSPELQSLFNQASREVPTVCLREGGWQGNPIQTFLKTSQNALSLDSAQARDLLNRIISSARSGVGSLAQTLGVDSGVKSEPGSALGTGAMPQTLPGLDTAYLRLQDALDSETAAQKVQGKAKTYRGNELPIIRFDQDAATGASEKKEEKTEPSISMIGYMKKFLDMVDEFISKMEGETGETTAESDDQGTSPTMGRMCPKSQDGAVLEGTSSGSVGETVDTATSETWNIDQDGTAFSAVFADGELLETIV